MASLSEDAEWRSTLGTNRVLDAGNSYQVVPDYTRAMASDYLFRSLPAQNPEESDFYPFLQSGTSEWDDFFSVRKVVHRPLDDGGYLASVTSNVADLKYEEVQVADVGVGRTKVKRFDLVHFLTDPSLVDKFNIVGALRAEVRNLAVVNTEKAARRVQAHIRTFEGYERSEVSAGKYAGSWKAARDSVIAQSARFSRSSVTTEALFVGEKLFIYGMGESDTWRVAGPESISGLLRKVHAMVEGSSPQSVAYALGWELTMLDIDICDGYDVLSPVRERHAGPHDDLPAIQSPRVESALSIDGRVRLGALCEACVPLAVDGQNCATAVRITSKYVLVSSHVVNEPGQLTSNGQEVVPYRMLSHDLWLASLPGGEAAWPLREAVEDEMVVLCYRRHDVLCYGGPCTVEAVNGEIMALTKDTCMRPGVSGAAVVSLNDFALLAVYDGAGLTRGLAASFTPSMYTSVCTMSEVSESEHGEARGDKGTVYTRMCERGFGKIVDSAWSATVPLYAADQHIGMGFSSNGKLLTLCDPDIYPMSLQPGGVPMVFHRNGRYFSTDVKTLPPPPIFVREPAYGERVFVVGKDADGGYSSVTSAKVSHVGVNAEVFSIVGLDMANALPMMGGLIVAYADGAVLGSFLQPVYGKKGSSVTCVSLPKTETREAVELPEAALLQLFPFLRPSVWPENVAKEVLTHPSAAGGSAVSKVQEFGMIGDSAMRSLLCVKMQDANLPPSKWNESMQRLQSNAMQAALCERCGLSSKIRVGSGVVLPKSSKAYADMLEAVAGAVYRYDTVEAFEMFCSAVGVIDFENVDSG